MIRSTQSSTRTHRPLAIAAATAAISLAGSAHAGIADANNSGSVGLEDLSAYLTAWFNQDQAADVDQNGDVSVNDLFIFIAEWVKEMTNPHRQPVLTATPLDSEPTAIDTVPDVRP